jgi:hypothetical protein
MKRQGSLGSSLVEASTKQERSKLLCKQSPFFSALSDVGDRCSAGKTTDGQKYQETHPNWQQGVVSPWYDFLRLRHRKYVNFISSLNLIRKLAVEERHRRASLWAQPSTSQTDATSPIASSQYQPTMENPSALVVGSQSPPTAITSPQKQNLATVPSLVASSQYQTTMVNTSAPVGLQSPPTAITSPQNQNLSTVSSLIASSQYQTTTVNSSAPVGFQSPPTAINSPQNQNLATVPSLVASSQYQTTMVNTSAPVGSQSPPTSINSPQNQNLATVPGLIASSQYQTTMVNTSAPVGSQSPPTAITSPQNQNLATVPSLFASSQYQTTMVNTSAPVGSQSPPTAIATPQNQNLATVPSLVASSQSPTAIISPQVQTTTFDIQQPTFNFHDPAMLQNGVAQHPGAESPMTHFLNSTSRLDSYNWGGLGDNTSMSFNSSDPFDFSAMNFSSAPSSPLFGMDQQWKTNTLGANLNASSTSLLDPIAPTLPTSAPPTSTTADGFIPANSTSIHSMSNNTMDSHLRSAIPTSAPPTSTTADGFIPANSTGLALNTATNTLCVTDGTDGTRKEGDDDSKKRKSYEERNAHRILPEGSRRSRKSRRIEGAEDENKAGPKKRNANVNKKGKGSKGKK